jgi:hypothetical protein
MGGILSGGSSRDDQIFWSKEDSQITIQTERQTWIGGQTTDNQGQTIEAGGRILASKTISITAGDSDEGISIKAPGAAQIAVSDKDGTISLNATQAVKMDAVVVAGGEIINETIDAYGKNASIEIIAGGRIWISNEMIAGQAIQLSSTISESRKRDDYELDSIVLTGSAHLSTNNRNSIVSLSGDSTITIMDNEGYSIDATARGSK